MDTERVGGLVHHSRVSGLEAEMSEELIEETLCSVSLRVLWNPEDWKCQPGTAQHRMGIVKE